MAPLALVLFAAPADVKADTRAEVYAERSGALRLDAVRVTGDSARNEIRIEEFVDQGFQGNYQRGYFDISDSATRIVAGTNCDQRGAHEVRCHVAWNSRWARSLVRLRAEGGNDLIANDSDAPLYGHGDEGDDVLRLAEGDSNGDGGNDQISVKDGEAGGGGGNDRLEVTDGTGYGDSGDDTLIGSDREEHLNGGSPDPFGECNPFQFDRLEGHEGNDALVCGDVEDGGPGADGLRGTPGSDRLSGGPGGDDVRGYEGNDLLDNRMFFVEDDADDYNGGPGRDTLSYAGFQHGIQLDLQGSGPDGDSVTGVEDALGGGGADEIRGTAAQNTLSGGDGADLLVGRAGDDVVLGQGGGDTLVGDDPADSTVDDADRLHGGSGVDTADYGSYLNPLALSLDARANDGVLPAGEDNVATDVEDLLGGGGADALTGNRGANEIHGGKGGDRIIGGGSSRDELFGEEDDDVLMSYDAQGLLGDLVDCGIGDADVATVDPADNPTGCENLIVEQRVFVLPADAVNWPASAFGRIEAAVRQIPFPIFCGGRCVGRLIVREADPRTDRNPVLGKQTFDFEPGERTLDFRLTRSGWRLLKAGEGATPITLTLRDSMTGNSLKVTARLTPKD